MNVIDRAILLHIVITAVGTFFGTALFVLVRRIIRKLPELRIPKIPTNYYNITIKVVQIVIALSIAVSVIFALSWIVGKMHVPSPGVRVVCHQRSSICTDEERFDVYRICIAKADVLAMEMFSEGLSSGGMRTQLAAMSAVRRAKRKQFTLCVLESGFATESCDKNKLDCF